MKHLTLSLVAVVIVAVMGTGWVVNQVYSWVSYDINKVDDELNAYKALGKNIALTLDNVSHQDEFIQQWAKQADMPVYLQAQSSFPVPDNLKENFRNGLPLLLESEGDVSLHINMQNSNQVMTMLLPVKNTDKRQPLLSVMLTLLFYLIVVFLLLAWLYPLIKRLFILQESAKKFGKGDLSYRITPSKISYIANIENEFNRMAGRIQKLVDDNKLLSRAVSHDLKTPLTRLRFGIDVLEEATSDKERKKYVERINKNIDEMQSLVETLLRYAGLDEGNVELQQEKVELNSFVTDLFFDVSSTNITVKMISPNVPVTIYVDPVYLAMQLNNIMINAVIHASSIVKVSIKIINGHDKNKKICIFIEDDGDGIPKNQRENVIKPFWRGKHDGKVKGHGMGLAITARIADWLKADLDITDSKDLGGASVSLCFSQI
ncbi:MAG: signal transduction histidine kinase [Pseudohongiellaceae bacterium]|jgi:signal transduction histidine kinase